MGPEYSVNSINSVNAEEIAARLVLLRGEKSQEEVAKDLGITCDSLVQYELGSRIPNDPLKLKIAGYYGEKAEDIFFGGRPMVKVIKIADDFPPPDQES